MKRRKIAILFAVCLTGFCLAGCGGEAQKIYEQAEKDLTQGSYEYALQGYQASVENGVKLPYSYRGAGIANLRMGNYEAAAQAFTDALGCEKVSKSLRKDLLSYRATVYMKQGDYENAMADCQTLSEEHSMDTDLYFLAGKAALSLDSYEEAAGNFREAYGETPSYDMAIRIYEAYLEEDMEADGTGYLEAALESEPKDAQDYCNRGRVYYYMDDYDNARESLIKASNEGNTEALLLLGMVYMAQKDISNARSMYQEFVSKEEKSARGYNGLALCDISEGNYDSALANIASGITAAEEEEMQSLLFNEIVVYERKLDFTTALQKVKDYLSTYPEDKAAVKEQTFLETRVG